ncbi:MAG TPA: His/Gly/Thr/Pro-type tRNA ligase C-terminal domain-containing protein, partial [Gemmatimonadaceae bacterium]|nr:His/Gly/Thr/Pro-type tRNA ligase C-terminal domain-containing protein [Gemmatimonadaceae bacterium]
AHAWNTSWGVSTRLVGGLVMTHGDDGGVRIPPRLAPLEVVIVPIYRKDEERAQVLEVAERVRASLVEHRREGGPIRVRVDAREGMKPGAKYYEWELRGVPLRIELGPRDVQANQCVVVRRDSREKQPVSLDGLAGTLTTLLETMQGDMLRVARERLVANSVRERIDYGRFKELMEGQGAFVFAGWCGSADCEAQVKEDTKATIRVMPDPEFRSPEAPTHCLRCGGPATAEVVWARAY